MYLPVGILLGFVLIQPTDLPDIQTHLALLLDEFGIWLPQLPQIDLSSVEAEWTRLRNSIPEPWKINTNGLEFSVGEKIAERGLSAKHPVVLVPGIISTVRSSLSSSMVAFRCHDFRVSSPGRRLQNTVHSFDRKYGADSQ